MTSTTAACVDGQLRVTQPVDGGVYPAGGQVPVEATLVLRDGGAFPNPPSIPVTTSWDAGASLVSGQPGFVAGLTDAGTGLVTFGWDGGLSQSRAVGFEGCGSVRCAEWQECQPTVNGGTCINAGYEVRWTAPLPDASFNTGMVGGTVQVTRSDGGAVTLTSVPVVGAMAGTFSGAGGNYTGTLVLSAPEGRKTFVAGWTDGGPVASLGLWRDTAGPDFLVPQPVLPAYSDSTGFLGRDPLDPLAVKKDEVVTVRVTSTDLDVDPASVALRVTAGGQDWDAGVGAPCGVSPFCREYTLHLGPQPMDAFAATVELTASGRDVLGNPGSRALPNAFTVTRWKWARRVTMTEEIKASPAVGDGGVLFVATRGVAAGGLFAVTPQGAASSLATTGAIEASPAIGRNAVGADVVFYMDQTSGLRAVGALNGCGLGNVANTGSLAVLNDGQSSVRAVGVVRAGSSPSLQAAEQASCAVGVGSTNVPGMAYPANVVTDGTSVWYPSANGQVQRTGTTLSAPTGFSGFGAGSIYGLGLFGARFAGGAGVGRIFVANNDGTSVTGDNPMRHVSGVAVGRAGANDVLFALMQTATEQAELRRFDATGVTTATAVLPSSLGFDFPLSSIPGGTTPVLGAGGYVYAVANNGNVVAANQAGGMTVRWTRPLGTAVTGQVLASATLDCNRDKPASGTGVYYFATTTGWLVGYIVDSPGLDPTAPWPKYQHDARNTGNTTVSTGCP